MKSIKVAKTLDLSGVPCPQNTAKALITLECLDEEEILELIIDDNEPIANVPPALEEEGHKIVGKEKTTNNQWKLYVKRT